MLIDIIFSFLSFYSNQHFLFIQISIFFLFKSTFVSIQKGIKNISINYSLFEPYRSELFTVLEALDFLGSVVAVFRVFEVF